MSTITSSSTAAAPGGPAVPAQRIVHRRHWGAWAFGLVVLALFAALLEAAVSARIVDLGVVGKYIFSDQIVTGAVNSLMLGSVALLIAVGVGLVTALMRVSGNPILVTFSAAYVYLFRGTPMLIQLIFWFNAFPTMFKTLHIELFGWVLVSVPMTQVITPYGAALLGLSLAEGAYMAEIIRGGILAVDIGQRDAARSLGMTTAQLMRRIVIPQASRIIVPATGNQYIMLLKSTSLASTIGYLELLRISTDIYASNFLVVELLAVAGFWYLVMTAFATAIQTGLERRFPHR